jgi:AmpD protein
MIPTWLKRIFGTPSTPTPPPPPVPAKPAPQPISTPIVPPAPPMRFYHQTNRQSPNISPARTIHPTHIILHHTGGAYAGSVSWCMNPQSKVSYHVIIARNGKRTALAIPTQRTWHAGVSEWQGRKNCNDYSIGLAWEGDTATTPLSEDAILSAVEYLLPILADYKIPLKNILRHADIAPGRKNDCSPAAHAALLAALKKAPR